MRKDVQWPSTLRFVLHTGEADSTETNRDDLEKGHFDISVVQSLFLTSFNASFPFSEGIVSALSDLKSRDSIVFLTVTQLAQGNAGAKNV